MSTVLSPQGQAVAPAGPAVEHSHRRMNYHQVCALQHTQNRQTWEGKCAQDLVAPSPGKTKSLLQSVGNFVSNFLGPQPSSFRSYSVPFGGKNVDLPAGETLPGAGFHEPSCPPSPPPSMKVCAAGAPYMDSRGWVVDQHHFGDQNPAQLSSQSDTPVHAAHSGLGTFALQSPPSASLPVRNQQILELLCPPRDCNFQILPDCGSVSASAEIDASDNHTAPSVVTVCGNHTAPAVGIVNRTVLNVQSFDFIPLQSPGNAFEQRLQQDSEEKNVVPSCLPLHPAISSQNLAIVLNGDTNTALEHNTASRPAVDRCDASPSLAPPVLPSLKNSENWVNSEICASDVPPKRFAINAFSEGTFEKKCAITETVVIAPSTQNLSQGNFSEGFCQDSDSFSGPASLSSIPEIPDCAVWENSPTFGSDNESQGDAQENSLCAPTSPILCARVYSVRRDNAGFVAVLPSSSDPCYSTLPKVTARDTDSCPAQIGEHEELVQSARVFTEQPAYTLEKAPSLQETQPGALQQDKLVLLLLATIKQAEKLTDGPRCTRKGHQS